MGREAECTCRRDKNPAKIKVTLGSGELILRGGVRRSIAFEDMRELFVIGGELCFMVGDESMSLALGSARAYEWAGIIAAESPVMGTVRAISSRASMPAPKPTPGHAPSAADRTVSALLEEAALVSGAEGSLILAHISTPEALVAALEESAKQLAKGMPIWMVYARSSGHPSRKPQRTLGESHTSNEKVLSISPRPAKRYGCIWRGASEPA